MTRSVAMQPAANQLVRRVRSHMAGRLRSQQAADEAAQRVRDLQERVDQLERELGARLLELTEGLQEQRRLSQRIAALSDFVAEVVSATVRGDRAELDVALAKYTDGL
jgi:vacuolar-type H+-ATPase subunit I/STV1